MSSYSKINVIYRLQKWMDSVPGQTFLNYAYSWGASIVILGTLFKLTHLPGADLMLFIGMGTEVCVFFISAFDRPFDKTADGRDIPVHVTDEYLKGSEAVDEKAFPASQKIMSQATERCLSQQQETSSELVEATANYVAELQRLTEMLSKVSEQSARLTRDSEEMDNLNRTLTGICKVYEMQLKSASQQIGTIDRINEQSKQMAEYIEQLNSIYHRMIEAMTVNMRAATSHNP
nr:gliding motility protein GldL [Hoylesella enoeca]